MRRRGAAASPDGATEATPRRRADHSGNGSSANGAAAAPRSPPPKRRFAAPARPAPPRPSFATFALAALLYAALFFFVRARFYWTPQPLTLDPPTRARPLGPAWFTEGGARAHVDALAGPQAPPRQVSAPGLRTATAYVANECARLHRALDDAAAAAANAAGGAASAPPRARVAWVEQRVGPAAFSTSFLGHRFTNAYRRLSNVLCLLEPLAGGDGEGKEAGGAAAPAPPPPPPPHAVVLIAHHDAPVASPGAGDDASQVGVMLELLRAYAAAALLPSEEGAAGAGGAARGRRGAGDDDGPTAPLPLPAGPILFVFNGGEEPLCQAAHGFVRQRPLPSELALASTGAPPDLGAFINLESIGPGGVPTVFQHSGAWTVRAYARAAPAPRGSGAAQDAFDLNLVVGETDYARLSYQQEGKGGGGPEGRLPGLDVALIADGAAYHTDRDSPGRLRAGVLQETGGAVGAAAGALAAELARAAAAGDGGARLAELVRPGGSGGGGGGKSSSGGGKSSSGGGKSSSGGAGSGGGDQAAAAAAATPSWRRGSAHRAVFFSIGSLVMVRYDRAAALFFHGWAPLLLIAAVALALARGPPSSSSPPPGLLATGAALARAALRAAGALALAVAASVAAGALRAGLSGVAIAWYSSPPALAALIYLPPAAAALLLVWSGVADDDDDDDDDDAAHRGAIIPATLLPPLPTTLLGAAVLEWAAAALLTWAGFGCAYMFAAWAYASVLAAALVLALEGGGRRGAQGQQGGKGARPTGRPRAAAANGGAASKAAAATAPLLLQSSRPPRPFRNPLTAPLVLLLAASLPALLGLEHVLVFAHVLGDRLNLSGATAGVAAADAAIGAIAGAGVAATMGGVVAPLLVRALGTRARVRMLAAGLVLASVLAATWASVAARPYSAAMPKRLLMSRVHFLEEVEGAGGGGGGGAPSVRVARSGWAFGGTDPNPVEASLVAPMLRRTAAEEKGGGRALRRVDPASGGDGLSSSPPLPTRHPLALIYPIDAMADVVLFVEEGQGEEGDEAPARLPAVRLLSDRVAVARPGGEAFEKHDHRVLELVATSPEPCWGLLNVTVARAAAGGGGGGGEGGGEEEEEEARLLSWSLTPDEGTAPASHVRTWPGGGSVREHVVRWTSEEEDGEEGGGPRLPVTMRVWPPSARVRVELHVAPRVGATRDAARERMAARLPDWAALTWDSTTYIGAWEF
jgi:hypothetical protein